MGQLLIENIEDEVLRNLNANAQSNGQTLEDYVRALIEAEGKLDRQVRIDAQN